MIKTVIKIDYLEIKKLEVLQKSMVLGYVLWYFLGLFGAHRFYLGKTGTAIAQLVLTITIVGSIVSFIWVLVDAFLLHIWITEHNLQVINEMQSKKINKL
jgi:TM2 domain-containing membrane protein YozV